MTEPALARIYQQQARGARWKENPPSLVIMSHTYIHLESARPRWARSISIQSQTTNSVLDERN